MLKGNQFIQIQKCWNECFLNLWISQGKTIEFSKDLLQCSFRYVENNNNLVKGWNILKDFSKNYNLSWIKVKFIQIKSLQKSSSILCVSQNNLDGIISLSISLIFAVWDLLFRCVHHEIWKSMRFFCSGAFDMKKRGMNTNCQIKFISSFSQYLFSIVVLRTLEDWL